MTRSPAPLLLGSALLMCAPLVGCASDRERAAWSEWTALDAGFVPEGEGVAPLSSATPLFTYVALALARNPALQAEAQRWRAQLERVPQARGLPDPVLGYGAFLEPIETRVGPQRHQFGISQRFPWPGRLVHASRVALEESQVARAKTDVLKRRIVYEVARAYADAYELARERAILGEVLSLLHRWEQVAQTRLGAGARSAHRDVIKAQVEVGQLEDRLRTLEAKRRPSVARLRALLHLPLEAEIPWPQRIPDARLVLADEAVVALSAERSPLLAQLEHGVAARERGVDLAWQSYLPGFELGLLYVETGPADRGASGLRPSGSGDDALLARVGITLPIWLGRYGAQVSEARARLRAAELDRVDAENHLRASLERALFDHHDAERKVRLYRDTLIPKAEQSLKANAAAYEANTGSFLDVLDAQRVLLEFHLARERARAQRVTSFAELELLSGADLTQEVPR